MPLPTLAPLTQALPLLATAQLGAEPPALPAPPAIPRFLFESWWAALLLVVAGIAAFIILSRRPAPWPKRALPIGGGLIALGVIAALTSHFVITRREALTARTEALIAAVARADQPALEDLLAPDASAEVAALARTLDRRTILDFVATSMKGEYQVRQFAVLEVQAVIDGSNSGRTQTRVRVTPEAYPVPLLTWWRLHWREEPDGQWRLTLIEGIGAR